MLRPYVSDEVKVSSRNTQRSALSYVKQSLSLLLINWLIKYSGAQNALTLISRVDMCMFKLLCDTQPFMVMKKSTRKVINKYLFTI